MPTTVYISDDERGFRIPSRKDLDVLLKNCYRKQAKTLPDGKYYAYYDFEKVFGIYGCKVFYRYLRSQEQPDGYMMVVKPDATNARSYVWGEEKVLACLLKGREGHRTGAGARQELFKTLLALLPRYVPAEKLPWKK